MVTQGLCNSGVCLRQECGNGVADGLEDCDGDDLRGETCASIGYYDDTPTLRCAVDCRFDGSECSGFCGDGTVNGDEPCDGEEIAVDCTDFGYYESAGLACSNICTALTDQCSQVCGDGLVNGPELCDGGIPVDSCVDFGFDRGATECSGICSVDFSACARIGIKAIPQEVAAIISVWESPTGRIYGAGLGIYEFNGSDWDQHGTVVGFGSAIWGTSDSDIYATDLNLGTLRHYDGSTWSLISLPGEPTAGYSVHGTSASNVYTANNLGVFHYDGTGWTLLTTGPVAKAVFAVDASNIFAVEASGGGIWHYNGVDTWTQTNFSGYVGSLNALWGTSTSHLFAAGGGAVLSYDGADWTQSLSAQGSPLFANLTGNTEIVIAVGHGGTYEFDGAGWLEHDMSDSGIVSPSDVEIRSDGSLIVVGGGGAIFSGASAKSSTWFWTNDAPEFDWSVTQAIAVSRHEVLVVGLRSTGNIFFGTTVGKAAKFTNGVWQEFSDDIPRALFAMWSGDGGATAVAVGALGEIRRYDGSTWTKETNPQGSANLRGIWGSGPENILAVGESGTLLRYSTTWTQEAVPTTQALYGVMGFGPNDIYIVGTGGTAFHYAGTQWTPIDLGTSEDLRSIWGSSASDVFVVGTSGTIVHFDGTSWEVQPSPTLYTLSEVHGTGPDNVYAIGGGVGLGMILHYDGARWSQIESRLALGDLGFIRTVFATAKDTFFIGSAGYFQHLFRRD